MLRESARSGSLLGWVSEKRIEGYGSFSRLFLRSEDVIQFQTCTEACPFGMVACGFQ
jgi:hypothetical protein